MTAPESALIRAVDQRGYQAVFAGHYNHEGNRIIAEAVFGYPGLGRLIVYGIQRRDVILIQACSMVVVMAYSISNLVADILYSILNPRIRYN